MSDNLVERLRKSGDACEFTFRSKLLHEAADEIERLRSELYPRLDKEAHCRQFYDR